ncbi:DUF3037 domain-containing protein [Rhizobium sp. BK196]|uniref:DUF3037 domain-containing protein n=1 Tax=Rhizobium sp. BK196 TaxID=2587073 RepID=UPI001AEE9D26|nr:DUF3037 domain-containing protein [Rhizobium sp. BK196]
MSGSQGYFSLVQYAELPERAEYVNIGIVVFVCAAPYVFAKFSQRPRRVQAAFNVNLGVHFELLQASLSNRLRNEFGNGWSKDSLENFVQQRSGKVRLSPIRSLLIKDPAQSLDELFSQLVGEVKPIARPVRARTKLASALKEAGVDTLLERPEPVQLSSGVRIDAQYGYQNGAFNLIDAISLAGDPDKALNKASPRMIEGSLLYRESLQQKRLVVIADESEAHDASFVDMVSSQMEQHKVRFYTLRDLSPLVLDIRKNYALHH